MSITKRDWVIVCTLGFCILPAFWIFGQAWQDQWIFINCRDQTLISQNQVLCAEQALRERFGALLTALAGIAAYLFSLITARLFSYHNLSEISIRIALPLQFLWAALLRPQFQSHGKKFLFAILLLTFVSLILSLRRAIRDVAKGMFPAELAGGNNALPFYRRLFFASVALHIIFAFVGFTNPPSEHHGFRQTQTAISIYYMLAEGFRLDYITPVLGKPWSIPMEFPLYQYLSAILTLISGVSLELVSRLVSLCSFYVTGFLFARLLRQLKIVHTAFYLVLTLFFLAPLHIFFSRTILIETFALMLGMAWLLALAKFFIKRSYVWLILAVLAAVLLSLTKITTFVVFACFAAGIVLYFLASPFSSLFRKENLLRGVLVAAVGFLIPLVVAIVWVKYTDAIKLQNPLAADFITSAALKQWNFGTLQQRLGLDFWGGILLSNMRGILGYAGIFLFLFCIPLLWKSESKYSFWCRLALSSFFSGPLIFSNLYAVHDYYYVACAVFAVLFVGLILGAYLEAAPARTEKFLRWSIVVPLLVSMMAAYATGYFRKQLIQKGESKEIAEVIEKVTRKSDFIIIYGYGWDPEIPYFSKRRAIMEAPGSGDFDGKMMQSALNLASDENLGAVILNSTLEHSRKAAIVQKYADRYSFAKAPLQTVAGAEIYVKNNTASP